MYIELGDKNLELEMDSVLSFVKKNKKFKRMYVFPKNITLERAVREYSEHFDFIRVNSKSWLYRSSKKGVSRFKRILRYIDTFLPLYEIFCDKTVELNLDNYVIGTHFFRGNLKGIALLLHVFRLKLGVRYLNIRGRDAHVWSHPHNFSGNLRAIKEFVKLGKDINNV